MISKGRFAEAYEEVSLKSEEQIELETAENWAARAVACYVRAAKELGSRDDLFGEKYMEWFIRAEDFKHEALEHGAQVGDGGATVKELEVLILEAKSKAKRKSF